MKYLRVSGVYNIETINILEDLGVRHFSFDLRPRSLNFTQIEVIKNLLKVFKAKDFYYSFVFEDDKPYMIESFVDGVKDLVDFHHQAKIELSKERDLSALVDVSTSMHLSSLEGLDKYQDIQKLKSLVIPNHLLYFYQSQGTLTQHLQTLFKMPNKSIELKVQWQDELMSSVIDFYPFHCLVFEIGQQVEQSFKNIDLNLVHEHIVTTKRNLNLF